MKNLFTIAVLLSLALNGVAQILNFDFSAECETGQILYYRITSEEEHTVILTYPYSEENSDFYGHFYQNFDKPQGDVVIPSVVAYNEINYSVTAIDSNTFWECNITSVYIPNCVSIIAPRAFASCASLESITIDETNPVYYAESNAIIRREDKGLVVGCKTTIIPDDVEIICNRAFYASGDGGDLIIPSSVKTIEDWAFAHCGFSGSLILSEGLETIGPFAFNVSRFSGSLTIPNSVTEIGHNAFQLCGRLTGNLTISSSLSTINNCAFASPFTGTLIIPNSVEYIGNLAFNNGNFSELELGNSVITIGVGAFLDHNNLTGVLRLPASLTEIGCNAFRNTSFHEIYSLNVVPPILDSTELFHPFPFDGYDPTTPIHIPYGCTAAYQNTEGWNYFTNFIEAPAPVIPDLYTIGYKDNNSTTRTAKLYKNNTLLHSIKVTGKQVTPYKIANDSEGNIYWMVVYSTNSSTQQTEIWKNDELYLSTPDHNSVTIKDLYCLGDTLFYVGNTTTEEGIKVATVWRGPDFTPHWVLGDGQHDSFIYDADVDKNTNIPYFCGYITDSLKKASVWEASQLLYKQEPWGSQRASWASEISIDNGSIFTNGYLNYDNGFEIFSMPTIWKDNERISNFSPLEFINCLYAYQDDYYFTYDYPHGMYYGVLKNGHEILLQLSLNQNIQRIYDGFDDIYMVGKSDNEGSIWKNFELLSQRDDCDVVMDILAVEATDVDTTFTINNTEWYYEIINDDGSITYQYLECAGDTVVQGKRPKVIVRSNTHYDRNEITKVTHEYIYEENSVVYWWNKDLQEFTTLYNLNANAGDEWEIKVGTESLIMHVDAVENYEYEGQTYRMMHVSDTADIFSGNIVCSIGHLTSFFPEKLMNRGKGYRVEGIRCYWIDGELVFKNGDEDCHAIYIQLHDGIDEPGENGPSTNLGTFKVYPNPTNGVLFVQTLRATSLQTDNAYRITNLMGQTLLQGNITAETQQINIEKLPAGMYYITFAGETRKLIIEK